MDMFNLGPLPLGWECKIETKYGKLYFINHATKTTTWDDPRLATIPTPPYHVAITQPTAYFEDTIGSRWSSPLPSLKGFSLHRRGSSPRLGGSPRIAPSPTLPPRNKRNEQVILESRGAVGGGGGGSGGITSAPASGSVLHNQQQLFPYPHGAKPNSASAITNGSQAAPSTASPAKYNSYAVQDKGIPETIPERPNSRSSGCSSYYITSASNASTHISTSHLVSCDTDTAYKTICAMFPTAPETHVRHLFHKYHNRPNLVVSALQVEKHPLSSDFSSNQIEVFTPSRKNSGANLNDTLDHDNKSIGVSSPGRGTRSYLTDSPARTGTPGSLMRFSNNQSSAGSLFTKSWGSPYPPSPQMQMGRETPGKLPTKSPNMKLKYMMGIFPSADETVLLDVLASCENNVQRASERLMRKGFARTPPPKPARQKWLEVKSMIEKRQKALDQQKIVNFQHEIRGEPQESPFPTPIMKTARPHGTAQQKMDSQKSLMNKFPNLPDRFIAWALEVAQFHPEKAERLLKEVCPQTPEEFKPFITTADKTTSMSTRTLSTESTSIYDEDNSEKSDESRAKADEDRLEQLNKENVLPLIKSVSKTFADKELQTPDSGYFEPEQKPRKKGFLANLFSRKSDKSEKFFSLTNKKAKGANPSLAKGTNPALIQKTYVQPLGPSKQKKGPDPNNRTGSQYQPKGPNPNLVHGPMWTAAANKSRYTSKPQVTFDVVGGHDF